MPISKGGLQVGRIAGILITVDWSWIFIFLLVVWSLAAGYFPQWHPEWSPALGWTTAVIAALLFFASILLHELAHSLVARSRGLPVHRITLFLFGGVSNLEREPASPGTEFIMALVGPLTSFVLGIIFTAVGMLIAGDVRGMLHDTQRWLGGIGPMSTLLLWLGQVNILISIFNMVPAFPLDGGRVVRSMLWALTGNLRKATVWASHFGQGIAWFFIIGGIMMAFGFSIPLLGRGIIGGLWLAFVGWFLNNAAVMSHQQVVIEDILQDVPVSRLMRTSVPHVSPATTVGNLVQEFIMVTDDHAFPIMDGDRLIGLVCLEDVRKLPRAEWESNAVTRIMTPAERLITTVPDEHAAEALRALTANNVRQLPVMEQDRFVGLLRLSDMMMWIQLREQLS